MSIVKGMGGLTGVMGTRLEVMAIELISLNPTVHRGSRFFGQFKNCQARGFVVKSSYSVARNQSEDIGSMYSAKLLGSESSQTNGVNGACMGTPSSENYVLDAYEDEYGGMVINPERLPQNAHLFAYLLRSSLSHWKLKGKTGIWLELPLDHSELVPVAVKEGFKYHHAEENYIMLTYWIPEGPCMLPANASHQFGIGGFVINEKNEVLGCKRSTVLQQLMVSGNSLHDSS